MPARVIPLLFAMAMLCFAPSFSCAQNGDHKQAIDAWLEKALRKNPSTAGQRDAIHAAEAKWDTEMNRLYKKLIARLGSGQKAALQRSQRAWLAYRDAEFKLAAEAYSSKQGTMWLPMHDDHCMEITRQRALQLDGYSKLLDE